jgi:hypothetical protein
VLADGWPRYLSRSCHAIFMTSKVNVLLPCVPLLIYQGCWEAICGTGRVSASAGLGWRYWPVKGLNRQIFSGLVTA